VQPPNNNEAVSVSVVSPFFFRDESDNRQWEKIAVFIAAAVRQFV
jgi:hypothetical protein